MIYKQTPNFTLVIILIMSANLFLCSKQTKADEPVSERSISVYKNTFNTYEGYSGELSITFNGLTYGVGVVGSGENFEGYQMAIPMVSVTKKFEFSDTFYGRLGVVFTPDHNMVGPFNFRTTFGADFGNYFVEYSHMSSAGIYEPNWGIDIIGIGRKF